MVHIQRQHYSFMEDNFASVNQRCWNTQSQSPAEEGKFLSFKVTIQGRIIEKRHFCCDVCAQDCACGQDCPQNVGTMVSKMTLPAADDAPRGRSVSESDGRSLKSLLEEC